MQTPLHRCSSCQRLVAGRCPHCVKTRDRARPNAAQRGYLSPRWRALRAFHLKHHPLCAACWRRGGRTTLATCVDHIVPHQGPDTPLFWDRTNLQSLCASCHSRKTATQDSTFARQR
jgi:5-methylcytosine-specific restriction protein A